MSKSGRDWTSDTAFDRAASLILDTIESEFGIQPASGRIKSHRAVVNILVYYCSPKLGETSIEQLREQLRLMLQSANAEEPQTVSIPEGSANIKNESNS